MPRIVMALAGAALLWPILLSEPGFGQNPAPKAGAPAPTGAGTPQQSGTPPPPGGLPQPGNQPPATTTPPAPGATPPPPSAGTQPSTGTGPPSPTGVGPAAQPSSGPSTAPEETPPSAQPTTPPPERRAHREGLSRPYGRSYTRWGYVTPWSGPYVIERAHGYAAFVVEGDWVRAHTACWGWKAGERVSFRPGPAGECVLVNHRRHQICPVFCERWGFRPYF